MTEPAEHGIRYGTAAARWLIWVTVLASGMVFLDGSVVNVALSTIKRQLHTDFATLQWVVDGYMLTLSAFLLLGGSLGDRYGRRRIFTLGLVVFAFASMVCGLAQTATQLVIARGLQGLGGALLVPGSLALISTSFHPDDRVRAVAAWSAFSGVTTALGPLVGGYLVDHVSWRWVFYINLPFALASIWIALRHVDENRSPSAAPPDMLGALSAALGLGGMTYAFIEGPPTHWATPALTSLGIGALSTFAFLVVEARRTHPMLPLSIFRSRTFTGANLVTLFVYFALGGAFFLLVLELQTKAGYTALEAGSSLMPITLVLLLLSSHAAKLAQRVGFRWPMTIGALIAGAGLCLLAGVKAPAAYWTNVFPGVMVFSLGLALLVAPLTSVVLASAPNEYAGVASAVNNAVARAAGLFAVALLPLAGELLDPTNTHMFSNSMWVSATLCILGGFIALFMIRE